MDISNIPTDNLYKFLSISGLLILAISTIIPEYSIFQLEMKKVEVKANQEKILIEGKLVELNLEKFELERNIKEIQIKNQYKNNANSIEASLAQLEKNLSDYDQLLSKTKEFSNWQKNLRDHEAQDEQVEIISKKIERFSKYAAASKLIGLLMALTGFIMWYCKTQRHLDLSIANAKQ